MRLLVLGSGGDVTLHAIMRRMAHQHGPAAVRFRSFDDLAQAVWVHRIGRAGVSSELRFPDGSGLADFAPTLVLNRLVFDPGRLFAHWSDIDRDYARMELYALLLSFLQGFECPVVNRPDPAGLSGAVLRPLVWCARAAEAGLPLHDTGATTSTRRFPPPVQAQLRPELMPALDEAACARLGLDRPLGYANAAAAMTELLVIGDRIVGGEGLGLDAPCLRLARGVSADLLGIRLARSAGDPQWRFVTADPMAPIVSDVALAALAQWLEARAAA